MAVVLVLAVLVYSQVWAVTASPIQIRRGLCSALPASAAQGELLYCTDTHLVYVGNGTGSGLTLIGSATAAPATTTTLGGIKVGSGLSITSDGTLNNTGIAGVASFKGRGGAVVPASGDYSIGQISGAATVAATGSYNDLGNKPTIPSAQVASDWTSSTGVSQILNKPTVPTALSQLTADSTHRTVTDAEKSAWNTSSASVNSVNGHTGTVTLTATDVSADPLGSATSVQTAVNTSLALKLDATAQAVDSAKLGGTAAATVVSGAALGATALQPTGNGSGLTKLNASNLTSGTVPAALGGAGATNGILKANGSGGVSQATSGDITTTLGFTPLAASAQAADSAKLAGVTPSANFLTLAAHTFSQMVTDFGTALTSVFLSLSGGTMTGALTVPQVITSAPDGSHSVQPYNSITYNGTGVYAPAEGMLQTASDGHLYRYHGTSWVQQDGSGVDTAISFSDNTTGNASTSQHGFLPKLGGGTTNFLRADGGWAAPSGSGTVSGGTTGNLASFSSTTGVTDSGISVSGGAITTPQQTAPDSFMFQSGTAIGSANKRGWSYPASAAASDLKFDLPAADPTTGQVLTCAAPSGGHSVCTWAANGSSGVTSVTATNSLSSSGGTTPAITLSGDVASPGNSYLYGTNGSGVKGWYVQPASGTNPGFNTVQSGTNTAAAMVVSTGSSLATTGSGTISATTANALSTARSINGVAFDGTGNITINAVDSTARVPTTTTVNGHALSGNVTVTPTDLSLVIGTNVQAYNANTTTAGNTFNGNSQLVQTTAAGKYPALDGSLITNLSSGVSRTPMLPPTITLTGNLAALDCTSASDFYVDTSGYSLNGFTLTNVPMLTGKAFPFTVQVLMSSGGWGNTSSTVNGGTATAIKYQGNTTPTNTTGKMMTLGCWINGTNANQIYCDYNPNVYN